ncbi:MAG: hypothetical protein O7B81_13700 [Gammaproteobacteria bacterium]|nr:hypothetical protein [Gammaproteobacteria bacterium]
MKQKMKQLGQGMTEYIIIVALIAIAAIAIYGLFGDTIRGQMGAMTEELAGETGVGNIDEVDVTIDDSAGTLGSFAEPTE